MSIIHHTTKRAALKKGYNLQVSQHAPEGYKDAYSLQCFSGIAGKDDRNFNLGSTIIEARANIRTIVAQLL